MNFLEIFEFFMIDLVFNNQWVCAKLEHGLWSNNTNIALHIIKIVILKLLEWINWFIDWIAKRLTLKFSML